tara:strand:+ start:3354 stop:4574 length:1221 start_codon:yes stop_codon:yes gene_type:complete
VLKLFNIYAILRLSAIAFPLITITLTNELNPFLKIFSLKIISLGWIGAAFFANEFYKDLYNSLLENDYKLISNLKKYINLQIWQFFITVPIIVYLFKANNFLEGVTLIIFLISEKIFDEVQRVLQFLDVSSKYYTFYLLTKRSLFTLNFIILAFIKSPYYYSLIQICIYCLIILLISFLFLYKGLKRTSIINSNPCHLIIKKLTNIRNLEKFKKSIPIKPFITTIIITISSSIPSYYFATIIPNNYFKETMESYLFSYRLFSIPFIILITYHFPLIRDKIRKNPYLRKLSNDYRFNSLNLLSIFYVFVFVLLNFILQEDTIKQFSISLLAVIIANGFHYIDDLIFWRVDINLRAITAFLNISAWAISYFILYRTNNFEIVFIPLSYLIIKTTTTFLIFRFTNKKVS